MKSPHGVRRTATPEGAREIWDSMFPKRKKTKPIVELILVLRDGRICGICGEEITGMTTLEIDHIVPLALGGPHHINNLQQSHGVCNRLKGATRG